jgi:hypothetical protein
LKAVIDFLVDYCQRHANPVNAFLHILGVPAVFIGLYDLCTGKVWRALILIAVGYFLQYLGHRAQGNEVGEVTLIKLLWKRLHSKPNTQEKFEQYE